MTSFRQFQANRRNALKSTGPNTAEGKQQSRRNAVRHGLTAETVIGALEDAEDYQAFEAAIIADYDAQSAVERELVLRLASLLWRLRRATTIETALFDMQAGELRKHREVQAESRTSLYALFRGTDRIGRNGAQASDAIDPTQSAPSATADLASCFLSLTNLPNHTLDRLSRYEAILWRQVAQTLFALHTLGRTKPQERSRQFYLPGRQYLPDRSQW